MLSMNYLLPPRFLFCCGGFHSFFVSSRLIIQYRRRLAMLHKIEEFMCKPGLNHPGTSQFWDDDHISKGMLESHLSPDRDGATMNHAFVRKSVDWIATVAPVCSHHTLLDLGCGPGIYAEFFAQAGYEVTGFDMSRRSIAHARDSARNKGLQITYQLCNYLTLDCVEQFDVATIINYDFGVPSKDDRAILLRKIHTALHPNGLFIFDVFTPLRFSGKEESKNWEYLQSGFFYAEPHLCLQSFYRYDEHKTILRQYLVITEHDVRCHNIWEHTFTADEVTEDLREAGFRLKGLYGDISGSEYSIAGETMCVIAEKIGE